VLELTPSQPHHAGNANSGNNGNGGGGGGGGSAAGLTAVTSWAVSVASGLSVRLWPLPPRGGSSGGGGRRLSVGDSDSSGGSSGGVGDNGGSNTRSGGAVGSGGDHPGGDAGDDGSSDRGGGGGGGGDGRRRLMVGAVGGEVLWGEAQARAEGVFTTSPSELTREHQVAACARKKEKESGLAAHGFSGCCCSGDMPKTLPLPHSVALCQRARRSCGTFPCLTPPEMLPSPTPRSRQR